MTRRLQIALLFGGRSGEHEVSVRSAASVGRALSARHDVRPVLIDHSGRWLLQKGPIPEPQGGEAVFLVASPDDKGRLRRLADAEAAFSPDIYFPVLHGTFGEDGTIQGLLELAAVPYVGSGVAASAASMDKELMKALFTAAGIPQVPYRTLRAGDNGDKLIEELGLPLFVKPANLGSSVGVSKVKTAAELAPAIRDARRYDHKVVVEAGIAAREIEVAILGNEHPEASVPGEIIPDREFYDYDSKYSADSKTELRIPATLSKELIARVQQVGCDTFKAMDASGFARIDFFLEKETDRLLVNEINTIPGFTSISMFPKLWEASGVAYEDLVTRLVELGLKRHTERGGLVTQYGPKG